MNRKLLATILAGLMVATAIIYLLAASEELPEASEETAAAMESVLFLGAATGYAIVAFWILKSKRSDSKNPYIVSIAGSAILIGLYITSRNMALPVVGLQDDIGMIDMLSKVFQMAIIGISISLLLTSRRIKVASNSRLSG
jgi:hypothetical protein